MKFNLLLSNLNYLSYFFINNLFINWIIKIILLSSKTFQIFYSSELLYLCRSVFSTSAGDCLTRAAFCRGQLRFRWMLECSNLHSCLWHCLFISDMTPGRFLTDGPLFKSSSSINYARDTVWIFNVASRLSLSLLTLGPHFTVLLFLLFSVFYS